MHLVYALELPEKPGEVQDELRIRPQASFRPEKEFRGRRFEAGDVRLLDYPHAEFSS
jgi:hypothetical protein